MSSKQQLSDEGICKIILYDNLLKKSADEAYKSVSKVVESSKLSNYKDAYEYVATELKSEQQKEKQIKEMKESDESIALIVFYEFLLKKPIGQTFKNIGAALGKDVIQFQQLKLKFDEFGKGKLESVGSFIEPLNDWNKMGLSDGCSFMSYSNFPVDVIKKIIGNLELIDRLSLRKVSKTLRLIVDNEEVYCDKLQIHFGDRFTNIRIDSSPEIEYNQSGARCLVKFAGKQKTVQGSYWMAPLMDLVTFLKNPKLRIGSLETIFLLGSELVLFLLHRLQERCKM